MAAVKPWTQPLASTSRFASPPAVDEYSPFKNVRTSAAHRSPLNHSGQTRRTAKISDRDRTMSLLCGRIGMLSPRDFSSCTRPVSASKRTLSSPPPWNPRAPRARPPTQPIVDIIKTRVRYTIHPPATARASTHTGGYVDTRYIADNVMAPHPPATPSRYFRPLMRKSWDLMRKDEDEGATENSAYHRTCCVPLESSAQHRPWHLRLLGKRGNCEVLVVETEHEESLRLFGEREACRQRAKGAQMMTKGDVLAYRCPPLADTPFVGTAHLQQRQRKMDSQLQFRAGTRAGTRARAEQRMSAQKKITTPRRIQTAR